jgi:hypothetical protein
VPPDRAGASARTASSPSTDESRHPHSAEAFFKTDLARGLLIDARVLPGQFAFIRVSHLLEDGWWHTETSAQRALIVSVNALVAGSFPHIPRRG